MNEIVQLTCCKHEASSRWKLHIARRLAFVSRSRIKKASHRQVIQRNSVSTRQTVTRTSVDFGISWNEALRESD